MDKTGYDKFQQKALKQTKQKKSKSAEFLMGEEERAAAEGIENPAFNISKTDLSAYQASEGKEIKHDRQDSSLAAHQQKNGLQAHAEPRGNERRQNYFDPPMDEEINPRQYGMEVSTEDDLELRSVREDEREFYKKLSKFFEEEETTVIDLPGMITEEGRAGPGVQKCSGVFPGIASLRQEVEDEVIPHYVEQFEECVQGDMIAVGSLSLEQEIDFQGDLNQQKINILHDKLSVGFQSAESQLLKTLKKRKGDVIAKYGELTKTKPRPDRIRGMKWKVEWSKTPQPVEIQLRCLRGVKDKLPQGSVTLKVSLYNRLGGYALHWSKAKEQLWAGTTQPVQHNGNFYNLELHVNQSVYTILPAKSDVQPGMVFIFELFLLPGTNIHMNQVVGWGAFPVCDSQFETLEGKFKCPLLRGHQDPRIDQFRKIEELISYDLDNWLCTIYFQVIKLPQSGQKEYEVTFQIPPHVHQSSDCFYACEKTEEGQKGCNTQESTLRRSQLGLSARCRCSSSYLQGKVCNKSKPENAKKTSDRISANEENGMYYKKESNPHLKADSSSEDSVKDFQYCSYADKLEEYRFSLRPQHSCSGKACGRDAERTHFVLRMFLSELGLSQWCSQEFWFIMLLLALIWFVRLYLHYCSQWLFLQAISVPVNKFYFYPHTVELSYQNSLLHTREELAMVVVGPLTLNVVMLLMVLIRWGCQLIFGSFPSFLSKFIMAIGLWTLLDPLAVFVVDAFLGHLAWSAENPIADAAKLYWLFYRTQHSGTPGVIITVFLYIVILICSLTILYMYFLRLHNGGRMLDVFQRVQSEEARFFVPLDMEVSNQELSYIVKKAEQWRGINGERRKVAVYDYIWTQDPSVGDPSCDPQHRCETSGFADDHKEITTHVSIYTIHLSGLRNLYRHFLRLPDGAIVEVTGDISGINVLQREVNAVLHENINEADSEPGPSSACELRERKKKAVWRSPRVEPAGRSCLDAMAVPAVSKR